MKRAKIKGSAKFNRLMAETMKYEGGWNPNDPSYLGVSQDIYDKYREDRDLPTRSVKEVTFGEARDIGKTYYWDKMNLDDIKDEGLQKTLFDYAWLYGTPKAMKDLQRAVGTKVDGIYGKKTKKAIQKYIKTHGAEQLTKDRISAREPEYPNRMDWQRENL